MRIAVFNYTSRGLFHYACALVEALTTRPEITHIDFFTSSLNELSLLPRHPKVKIHLAAAPHRLGQFIWWLTQLSIHRQLIRELLAAQPDVVHIADTYPLYPFYHFIWKKYPMVFTQHDPISHTGERYQFGLHLLHKYLQSISSKIVVHGAILKKQLLEQTNVPHHRIAIVPLATNPLLLKSLPTPADRFPNSILFIGRILAYKGLTTLISSLLLLQERRQPFHFTLAGEGDLTPYQADLKRLKNTQILNRYIPLENFTRYLQTSEITVFPYHEATQSAIVPLALAAGTSVVATPVGALAELVQHNYTGLLVPPHDASALAHALTDLLTNADLRQRLGAQAQVTATTSLTWSNAINDYFKIYQSAQSTSVNQEV